MWETTENQKKTPFGCWKSVQKKDKSKFKNWVFSIWENRATQHIKIQAFYSFSQETNGNKNFQNFIQERERENIPCLVKPAKDDNWQQWIIAKV